MFSVTGKSNSHGDVDGGEEPEENDGEEPTDRKDNEGGPAVHNGTNEQEETEEGEETKKRHCDWPS